MAAPDGAATNTPSAAQEAVITPEDLVEAFKASGGFDVLRASILRSFIDSSSGQRFSERTLENILEKLHQLHDPVQAGSSATSTGNTTSSSKIHTSPSRFGGSGGLSKAQATDSILRHLEHHTAYERAAQDMKNDLLKDQTKNLDKDLANLLEKVKAERASKATLAGEPVNQ